MCVDSSAMLAFFLAISLPQEVEDLSYGLANGRVAQMSVDSWLAYAERVKGGPLPEYEQRAALGHFSACVQDRINGLLAPQPAAKRAEFAALRKAYEEMLIAIHETEHAMSGGGTKYLTFHAYRTADFRVMVRDMLENKLPDPGPRKVSDGLAAWDRSLAWLARDPDIMDRQKATSAAKRARSAYQRVADSLRNRSRGHSNALIAKCILVSQIERSM